MEKPSSHISADTEADQDDEGKRIHYDHLFQYLFAKVVVAEQQESNQVSRVA